MNWLPTGTSGLRAPMISILKLKIQLAFPQSTRSVDKCLLPYQRLTALRLFSLQKFQISNLTPYELAIFVGSHLINRMAKIPPQRSRTSDFRNLKFQTTLPPKITATNGYDSSWRSDAWSSPPMI
jgi:hypothetical protein